MATSGSWNVDCTTGLYGQDSGARFQLQFSWSQSYVKGGSSSSISVSAKLVCTTFKYGVNASWWKNGQGNITITAGGKTIGSWGASTQLTTTALTYQGQVLWSGSTSFTLYTSVASSFSISITGGLFVNTGSTSNSITFPTTSSTQYTNAIPQFAYYTVSISQGTGTSLIVKNGSTTLSNGASVLEGSTLTASYSVNNGYTSGSMTVNGTVRASGYSWQIYSNSSVSSSASRITYTVSYNANGGSGAPGAQTKIYDQNLTLSSTKPSWTGRTFLGWATSASGSVAYQPGGTYSINASITLYAKWSLNSYRITINQGTGTTLSIQNGSTIVGNGASIVYGTTLKATFSTNTGYKSGWMTVGGTSQASGYTWTVNGDITVNSGATAKTYTVSYNANGGDGSISNSTATWGQSFLTKQNAFTRTGYTFNGWHERPDGAGADGGWTLTSSGVYESGKSWIWSYDRNVTLYAQWIAKTYTVSYNANGGSGSMDNSSATWGQPFLTRQNAFTRTGYTFNGWHERPDGAGADGGWTLTSSGVYESGKSWIWSYDRNVTLYAQWAVSYTAYTVNVTNVNSTISIFRIKSPSANAAVGELFNGDAIYTNDVLYVTASPNAGFHNLTLNVNGNAVDSGYSWPIAENANIQVMADLVQLELYTAYVDAEDLWGACTAYINNGEKFELYTPIMEK